MHVRAHFLQTLGLCAQLEELASSHTHPCSAQVGSKVAQEQGDVCRAGHSWATKGNMYPPVTGSPGTEDTGEVLGDELETEALLSARTRQDPVKGKSGCQVPGGWPSPPWVQ